MSSLKTRDTNEPVVQWIVYPHQQLDTNTGKKVIHNRCRTLVFPSRDVVIKAMQVSNPDVDVMAITRESGQNRNAADGSLVNDSGVLTGSLSKKHSEIWATWVLWI